MPTSPPSSARPKPLSASGWALARVSPVLLQQFRAEDMSFAQLSAFMVSDDHERQVAVWNSLTSWNRDQDPRGTVASFSAISTTVTAYIEAAIDGIVGPVSSSMAIPRPASEV